MKLFIAYTTLLLSLANARSLSDCEVLQVESLLIEPENSESDDTQYVCKTNDNMVYRIDLTSGQREMFDDMDIANNPSMLKNVPLATNYDGETIIVPSDMHDLKFRKKTLPRKRQGPEGIKPILVVRVTDKDGKVRPETAAQISDDIFGTLNDPVNLASQMNACSHGKLEIVTDYDRDIDVVAPGVIEVTIPLSIESNDRYTIHNSVTNVVQAQLGFNLPGTTFQQVMYVIENCYVGCGYAAYAYINSWMSVYISSYYKMTGVQMHEIGHNFGFAHSGGLSGATYTDHTCLMGNPLYSDDTGKMCFNPAKNWQIGWYNDRTSTLDITLANINYSETIVGVANYVAKGGSNDCTNCNVVIKLETGTANDYFVGFNRATGINSQNDEADNEVTIVQTGNNGISYSQSWLKATLRQGESFTINGMVVTAEDININTNPGEATISFKKGSGPAPTPSPQTRSPITSPVNKPTVSPVNKPTVSPVKNPTNPNECDDPGKYLLEVTIENDKFSKLKYTVTRRNANKWAKRKDMKNTVRVEGTYFKSKCVPKNLCYRFKIVDKVQWDGVRGGGWKVRYDSELIQQSTFASGAMEYVKFGQGCFDSIKL